MKICIDARPISDQMHGIARYALNLIAQLVLMDKHNEYLILINPHAKHLLPVLPKNFRLLGCSIPNYSIREQLLIPMLLQRRRIDLFHSTTYSAPVFQPCKTIVTIHDLIPVIFPQHYRRIHAVYYNHIVHRVLRKAGRIITVSYASQRDLVKHFGLYPGKITVIYNGVEERFGPDPDGLSKKIIETAFAIKKPYVLSVANPKPHKNVMALIKAFRKMQERYTVLYRLVIVGCEETIGKEGVEAVATRPTFLPKVTDDQLIALYHNATLFVLPTLYEGFCLPVLEAMACGVPVITSNISSLPEVTENAAILIDPNNIDELSEAIYNVLINEDLQKKLRENGIRQAKRFSWRKTAQQTLEVYEEVMSLVE